MSSYQFAYDIWGNVLSVTMNGRPLVSYDYGDTAYKGQVQTLTYGNNQAVYYTYNVLGQVIGVGYTNQPDRFTYVYDTDGSLSRIDDSVMSQSTSYTDTGYEIRTLSGTLIYSCSSDEDGNSTETINGTSFQSTVDSDTNTTVITDGNDASILTASHAYDAFDRLKNKSITLGDIEVTKDYNYNTDSNGNTGNLVSNYTTSYFQANDDRTQLSFSYTYDGNGNITDIVKTENTSSVIPTPTPVPDDEPSLMILGSDRIVTSYTYDAAGQLLEAIDGETDHIYRYTYDNCGNIRSAKTYVYDDDGNEVLSDSKTFGYNNGILASYTDGTSTVIYQTDAMGNPIRISEGDTVKTLSWGEGRMLLGVSEDASNYSQYTYNVDGLRTRKVVAVNGITTTTEYAWGDNGLAGTIIRDGTATTTVVPHYDSEGEAIGFTVKRVPSRLSSPSTTNTYTYVKTLQGDVLRILDSNGNAVVNYTYDPWGKPTVTGDEDLAALNPCSYRGYDYDEETGYYYLKSRYYNPVVYRFVNSDVYASTGLSVLGSNPFIYCNNKPINHYDPDGCSYEHAGGMQIEVALMNALIGVLPSLITGIKTSIASIKAAIATYALPVVCFAAIAASVATITYSLYKVRKVQAYASKVISAIKAQIKAKKIKPNSLKNYTVYVITRKNTTDVVYVGITKSYSSRQYTHQRKPGAKYPTQKYDMYPIATNLTRNQARALEQTVISAYGIGTLNNLINSISPSKWAYFKQEFKQMASLIEAFLDAN